MYLQVIILKKICGLKFILKYFIGIKYVIQLKKLNSILCDKFMMGRKGNIFSDNTDFVREFTIKKTVKRNNYPLNYVKNKTYIIFLSSLGL